MIRIIASMLIAYFIAIIAYSIDIENNLQSGTYKSLFYGTEYTIKERK